MEDSTSGSITPRSGGDHSAGDEALVPAGWHELDEECGSFSFDRWWTAEVRPTVERNAARKRPRFGQRFLLPVAAAHVPFEEYRNDEEVRAAVAGLFEPVFSTGPVHREHRDSLLLGLGAIALAAGPCLLCSRVVAEGLSPSDTAAFVAALVSALVLLGVGTYLAVRAVATLDRPPITRRRARYAATWVFRRRRATNLRSLRRVVNVLERHGFVAEVWVEFDEERTLYVDVWALHTRDSQRTLAALVSGRGDRSD